jgi:hypothetical protein
VSAANRELRDPATLAEAHRRRPVRRVEGLGKAVGACGAAQDFSRTKPCDASGHLGVRDYGESQNRTDVARLAFRVVQFGWPRKQYALRLRDARVAPQDQRLVAPRLTARRADPAVLLNVLRRHKQKCVAADAMRRFGHELQSTREAA